MSDKPTPPVPAKHCQCEKLGIQAWIEVNDDGVPHCLKCGLDV